MVNDPEPEEEKLVLMVSPTTGKVLLVLPGNILSFSGIGSVDSFASRLSEELIAFKQFFVERAATPIADGYGSRAIVEWEEMLHGADQQTEDSSGDM